MNDYLFALERIKRGQIHDDLYKVCQEDLDTIEDALKKYNELTSKTMILCARTSGKQKMLIDMICKNYKEVRVSTLESDKKFIAFDIIKEKRVYTNVLFYCFERDGLESYNNFLDRSCLSRYRLTKEEYDLLKEALTTDNECQKENKK